MKLYARCLYDEFNLLSLLVPINRNQHEQLHRRIDAVMNMRVFQEGPPNYFKNHLREILCDFLSIAMTAYFVKNRGASRLCVESIGL